MKCTCKKDFEIKIEEKVKQNLPDGHENYSAELSCYGLGFSNKDELVVALMIPYKGSVMVPKKSGGMKKQKIDTFIKASYCPFCGNKAD